MNDRVQEGWIGSGGDLVLMSETADEGSHQELDQPTKPHGTGDESHGAERWQPARSFWQPRFCQDSALEVAYLEQDAEMVSIERYGVNRGLSEIEVIARSRMVSIEEDP